MHSIAEWVKIYGHPQDLRLFVRLKCTTSSSDVTVQVCPTNGTANGWDHQSYMKLILRHQATGTSCTAHMDHIELKNLPKILPIEALRTRLHSWGKHAHNAANGQDNSVDHANTNGRKPPPDPQSAFHTKWSGHNRLAERSAGELARAYVDTVLTLHMR